MRQLKITKQVTNRETASLDKYLQEIGKGDIIFISDSDDVWYPNKIEKIPKIDPFWDKSAHNFSLALF